MADHLSNNRTKAATFGPTPAPEPPLSFEPEPPYQLQPPSKPEPIYQPEPTSEPEPPIDSPYDSFEVNSYFPIHRGCGVTLYQDAHCPPDIPHLSMVRGPNERENKPQSCWKNLYHFIEGAQHICCLTCWAIWTKLKLFRGDEAQYIYAGTLGELLVKKANQGVRVQVMVCSEFTSGILQEEGTMGAHSIQTYNFFKNARYTSKNKVLCALTPRIYLGKDKLSCVVYTHHQKSVFLDAACPYQPDGDGRRKLVAFVGGLDLTGGQYDNPLHGLYRTLLTDHCEDFRNPNHNAGSTVGPRQPWHDIHCRVEGPVAMKFLTNFVERWNHQASKEGLRPSVDEQFVNPFEVAYQNDPSQEWNVQLFRSITNDSAALDALYVKDLIPSSKTGRIVDKSIATAYNQIIWNAENFIYIENQYFMGWFDDSSRDSWENCNHIIPVEITKKITDKIQRGSGSLPR